MEDVLESTAAGQLMDPKKPGCCSILAVSLSSFKSLLHYLQDVVARSNLRRTTPRANGDKI